MADDSYNTQVVIEQGGKVLRIKGSGTITFDSGGTIDLTNATVTGGGAQQTIGNGQTLEIQSGATLQIDSGATLTMPNGTIVTAELNAGAVTGPKLDLSGLECIAFVGHNKYRRLHGDRNRRRRSRRRNLRHADCRRRARLGEELVRIDDYGSQSDSAIERVGLVRQYVHCASASGRSVSRRAR